MKKLLLSFFLLSSNLLLGQNIYTALHLNRPEDVRQDKPISSIIETNTFFNSNSVEKRVVEKSVNKNYLVTQEERFDAQGNLQQRLTRQLDESGNRILSRKFEIWNSNIYTIKTSIYEYDSDYFLIKMTDYNSNGEITKQAILTNNQNGHPLKLELFDGSGSLIGTEIGIYNYEQNQVTTEVRNRNGKTLSTDNSIIDFSKRITTPQEGDLFNDYGDLVTTTEYSYKRKYDDLGNWTTVTIYKLKNGRKTKNRRFKRKIEYLE